MMGAEPTFREGWVWCITRYILKKMR